MEEAAAAAAKRKEASKEAVRAEVCGKFTGMPGFKKRACANQCKIEGAASAASNNN